MSQSCNKRIIRIKKGKMFCFHNWIEMPTIHLRNNGKEWAHFKCSKCPAEKWHELMSLGEWFQLTDWC